MKRGGFGKDPGNSRPIACPAIRAEALLAKPDWHECRPGSLFPDLLPMTTLHEPLSRERPSPQSLHGEVINPSDNTASLGRCTQSP